MEMPLFQRAKGRFVVIERSEKKWDKKSSRPILSQPTLIWANGSSFSPEVVLGSAEISRILFFSRSRGNFDSIDVNFVLVLLKHYSYAQPRNIMASFRSLSNCIHGDGESEHFQTFRQ